MPNPDKPAQTDQRVIDVLESIANVMAKDSEIDRIICERLDAHDTAIASLHDGLSAVREAMATRADLDDAVLSMRDGQAS